MKFFLQGIVKEHFDAHFGYYIVFSAVTVVGLIIGIASASGLSSLVTAADIKILFFEQAKISAHGIFGLVGKNFLLIVSVNIIILALCTSVYLLPLCFATLVFRGYIIGFNMVIILRVWGTAGIFNIIVVYIPFHIVTLFCVIAAASVCVRRCILNARYGSFVFRCVDYPKTFKSLAVILALGFFAILALSILGSLFTQDMILVF